MPIKKLLLLFFMSPLTTMAQQNMKLWYNKTAAVWTEALPVGNGRLGAMVFGGVEEELLQLNEATLWSGGPVSKNINPQSPEYLPKVREALFKGDYETADAMVKKMQGLFSEGYLPLADLIIKQNFNGSQPSSYYRDLNISDAIAVTKYVIDGTEYKREIFVSAPAQAIIVRISSNKSNQLNVLVNSKSQLHYKTEISNSNELLLKGKAPAHADPSYFNVNAEPVIYEDTAGCRGMRFALLVKAITKDGKITAGDSGIQINSASEIILYITAATSFSGYDKCPDKDGKDEVALVRKYMNTAIASSYAAAKKAHLKDYHHFFNRVSLALSNSEKTNPQLPTDERLDVYSKGANDPALEALYFQYGRYLLISSSRTPEVPANLQGIWNKDVRPPWSSNYTTNINVQMNYWPAEASNLSEMTTPLFGLIKNIAVTGKKTAKEFYDGSGWVANHNSDIWAMSNPVGDKGKGDPKWANWAMGANWLTRHLWEHYLYTGDRNFLKETAYPLMKDAALFTLDWLVTDSSGHLVTAPSTSPENDYYYSDKKITALTIASTMDMGIIRDLFGNIVEAANILNMDKSFRDSIIAATNKLYPFTIGSKGHLQEWYKDYEDVDPHHRHVSHLYALHPANLISPITTPDLADAAKKTLEIRGDEGTGWSLAWKVNFWARLLDGGHAYKLYRNLMRLTKENNTTYNRGGGAYPNMFDAHPPFQIDGNFAGATGLMEMLLQSQGGEIFLLPALPAAWEEGSISGLKARGNYTVSMKWGKNELVSATVFSALGGDCVIRTNIPVSIPALKIHSKKSAVGYLLSFKAVKGKSYTIAAE